MNSRTFDFQIFPKMLVICTALAMIPAVLMIGSEMSDEFFPGVVMGLGLYFVFFHKKVGKSQED